MKKRLSRMGNGVGLLIEKPILKAMGLEAGSEVTVTFDGENLVISRAPSSREMIEELYRRIVELEKKKDD